VTEQWRKYKNALIASNHKLILLISERGRAIQMNKGAKIANGDILLFLHVDCILDKDALTIISRLPIIIISREGVSNRHFPILASS